MHEFVEQVLFVVFEKLTSVHLFQPAAWEKSFEYMLITYMQLHFNFPHSISMLYTQFQNFALFELN